MGSAISLEKTSVVASSTEVAKRLQSIALVRDLLPCSKNLGIDYAAGLQQRRFGSRTSRRAGLQRAKRRMGRLHLIAKSKISPFRVFAAGVLPATAYGAGVTGISCGNLLVMRRQAAACLPPWNKGASVDLKLAIWGDPTECISAAALLQWSKEVWRCITGSPRAHGLQQLRYWWARSSRPPKTWGEVTGPIQAAAKEVERLSWKWKHPLKLEEDRGEEILLTLTPPAALLEQVKKSPQETF